MGSPPVPSMSTPPTIALVFNQSTFMIFSVNAI
jgi:hypothetical protein